MPTTINGIGTHYYGQRNRTTHLGACNQCRRESVLEDYETTLWFCVLFIPIIPLGKKQIVNKCSRCTYHYAVPLKQWREQADAAVEQASQTLSQDTSDAAKVMQMHATLSSFHRHEEAADLAKVMLAKFADNGDVLFYLGSWHEHFTRFKEADALFVKAADAAPLDMEKQSAAVFALARQLDCDAALRRMEKLEPAAIPGRPDLVRHVARQFAAAGRSSDAYRLLLGLLDAAPHLAGRPDLQKEVRALEKKLGVKASRVPSPSLWERASFKFAAATAAILLVGAAVEGWNYYVMQNAPVHAVNGLNAPVKFSIDNGPALSIPSRGRIELTLPEGRHQVALLDPNLPGGDPFEIAIHQPWHRRFFSKPAFIVDPTRSAIILHSRVPYMDLEKNPGPARSVDTYRVGEPWIEYDHVDHRFEPLAEKVDLGSADVVYRSTTMLIDADPLYLADRLPIAKLIEASKRRLLADPHNAAGLVLLAEVLQEQQRTAELDEFVQTHLADDPPLLAWHRVHQEIAIHRPTLEKEYDDLLAAHPQNAAYLYLRGRLCDDGAQAASYFDKSLALDPNFAPALYAKALDQRNLGEYPTAADLLEKAWTAIRSDAAKQQFQPSEVQEISRKIAEERLACLLAAGRYPQFDSFELESRYLTAGGIQNPLCYLSLLRQGKLDEARRHREQAVMRLGKLSSQDTLTRGTVLLTFALYDSDPAAMRLATNYLSDPLRQQLVDLLSFDEGASDECNLLLGVSSELSPALKKALTMLRLRDLGRPYETEHADLLKLLETAGRSGEALAELFKKSPAATIEEIQKISLKDRERGIALIALAHENPPQQEAMLRYARKLLAIPELPQKCLDDWIKKGLGE